MTTTTKEATTRDCTIQCRTTPCYDVPSQTAGTSVLALLLSLVVLAFLSGELSLCSIRFLCAFACSLLGCLSLPQGA